MLRRLHLEIGTDTSRVDYACDVVMYSALESQAALDACATHPEHLRVKRGWGICALRVTSLTTRRL